jgi:hypothetical protein
MFSFLQSLPKVFTTFIWLLNVFSVDAPIINRTVPNNVFAKIAA